MINGQYFFNIKFQNIQIRKKLFHYEPYVTKLHMQKSHNL